MARERSSFILLLVILEGVIAVPQIGTERDRSNERCPNTCPDTVRPVCGTNNVVYRNDCDLFRAACNLQIGLGKQNDGPCVTSSALPSQPSLPGQPAQSSRCREECTKIYLPVCGSDGVTYNNDCLLRAASCKSVEQGGPRIEVVSDNACAGFEGSSGRRPSTDTQPAASLPDTSAVVTEACKDTCLGGFRPVCGTNNLTYGSDCLLEVAKCRNPGLEKKADGVCTKDCSLQCDTTRRLVCGTDGITYTNFCFLIVARCKDPAVDLKHEGQCLFVEKPECRPRRCPTNGQSLCGSDGITYRNLCQFEAAVCYNQGLLKLYDGNCKH